MKNYENIKTSFVRLKEAKALGNKTGNNFMIFILIFMENCLLYDVIHDFSVWPRTSSNPADIKRFRSHTGKNITTLSNIY